jgi:hypothetical protein
VTINIYEVPLQVGQPQTFSITLGGKVYQLTLRYRVVSGQAQGLVATQINFTADTTLITADTTLVTADATIAIAQEPIAVETNAGSWVLDIADDIGNPILSGIPLVTGANLLSQYGYLGFGGGLYVMTTSDPDAVPTFENLGDDGLLYWTFEATS